MNYQVFLGGIAGVLYFRIYLVSIHKLPSGEESLFSFCSKILALILARVFFKELAGYYMQFCEKEVAYIDRVLSLFSFQLLESELF